MNSQRLSDRSSGGSSRSRSSGSARVLNELPTAFSVSSPSLAGNNSGVALTGSLAWNQRRTVRVEPRAAVTTSSAISGAQHPPRKTLASVSSSSSVHNRPLTVGHDVPTVVSPSYPALHFSPPEAGLRPLDSARRELVSRLLAKGVSRWEPVDPVIVQDRTRPTFINAASRLQDTGNRSHTTSNGFPNGTGAHGAVAPYWETAAESGSSFTSTHPINSDGLRRHGGGAASETRDISSRARAAVPYWEPVQPADDPGRQTRPLSSRLSHPNDSAPRKRTFGHQRDFISPDNLASSDMLDFRDGPVMQWRSSESSSRQMATVTEAPSIRLQTESGSPTDRRVAPLSTIQPSTKLRKMPSRRKNEPKRYVADGIMRKIAPKPNVAFFCDLNVEGGQDCDTAEVSDVFSVSAAAQTDDDVVAVHSAAAVLQKTDRPVEMIAQTAAGVQGKPPAAVKQTSGKKKGSDLEHQSKTKRPGAVGSNGASKDAASGESGAIASSSSQSLAGVPDQKRSRQSASPRISNMSTRGSPTGSKRKSSDGPRRAESRGESPTSVHKLARTVKVARQADPARSPTVTRGRSAASSKPQPNAPTRMPIGVRRGRSSSARSGGSAATAGASGSSRGSAGSLQRKPPTGAASADAAATPPQSRPRRSQSRTDTERAELQVFMEQRKAQQRIVQTQQQRQLERQRVTKRQRLEALNWECRRLRRAAPVHTAIGGVRDRAAQTAAAHGGRQRTQLLTRSRSVGAISDRPWTAAATQRLRRDFVPRGTSSRPLELRPASAPRSAFRFSARVRGTAAGAAARRQLPLPARRLRGGGLGSKKPRNIRTFRSRLSPDRMGVFTADTEKRYHETRTLLENMSPPRQRAASAGVGGSLRTLTDLQSVRSAFFDSSPGGSMVEVYYVSSSSECSDCEAATDEVHVLEASTSMSPSRPQSAVSGASRSAPCVLHSRCPPPGAHRRLFEPGSAASCGGELETLMERSASCSQLDSSCGSSLQSRRAVVGTPRASAEEHNTTQSSHVSSSRLQTASSQQDLRNTQPLSEQRVDGIDTAGTGGTDGRHEPDVTAAVSCQFPNWFLLPPPLLCADTFASALRRKLLCAGGGGGAEQLPSGRPASPAAPPVTCHELADKSVQVSAGSLLLMTSSHGSPMSFKCEERPGRRGGSPTSLMSEDRPGRRDSLATQPPNFTEDAGDLSQSSSDVSSLPSLSSQCSSVNHQLAAPVWRPERSADGFVTLPVEQTCLTATATPAGIKAMSASPPAGQTTGGVEASPQNAAAGAAGMPVTQDSKDDTWVSPRRVSSSACTDQRSNSAQLNSSTSLSVSSLDTAASGVGAKRDRRKRSTNLEEIWPSDSDDFSEATKRIVDEYKARLKARREMRRADRNGGDSSDTSSASSLHPSAQSSSKRSASSRVVTSAAASGSNSGQIVSSNGGSSSHTASSSNRLKLLSVGEFGIRSLSETGRTNAPVGDETISSDGSSSGSVGSSTSVDQGSTFTEETTGSSDDSSNTVNGDGIRESTVPSSVKRSDDSAASSSNTSFRASILYSVQSSTALSSGKSVPTASSVNKPDSTVSSAEKFTPSASSGSISTVSSLRNMMATASSVSELQTVSSLRNMMATASSVSEVQTISSLRNMMATASSVSELQTVSSLRNMMATASSVSEMHTSSEHKSASMVSTAASSSVSSVSSFVSQAPSVEESICIGSSDDDSVQIVDVPMTSPDIQHVHAAPTNAHKSSGTSESASVFSRVSSAVEVASVLDGPSALESVAAVPEILSKVASGSQSSNRSLKTTVSAIDSVSTAVSVRLTASDFSAVPQPGGVSLMKRISVSSASCSSSSSASSSASTVAPSGEVTRADSPDPPSGTVSHVESVPLDTLSCPVTAPSAGSSSATDTVSSAPVSAGSSCDDQSVSASDDAGDGPPPKTGRLAVAASGAAAGRASSARQASMDTRQASMGTRQASMGTRQASMGTRQASMDTRQASVEGKPTHRLSSMDVGAMAESARSSEKNSLQLRSSVKQPLQTSSKASSPTSQTSQLVDSFTRFTLDMRRQLLQEEEQRALHRLALVDVQKKRILDNINADIKKLEMEKRKYKSDGVRTSAIRKKQRALLLKHDERKAELDRLKETDRLASRERQLMIAQCEELLKQVADVSEPQPASQVTLERQRSVAVHSASSVSTEPSVFSTSPSCSAVTSSAMSSAGRVAAASSQQSRPSAVSTSPTNSTTTVSSAAPSCSVQLSATVQSPTAAAGGSAAPSDICSAPAVATDRQQLNIKSPLAPHLDVRSHRRRHSSGSDDSISICLTETCSDQSDMEGRIVALEEELKRRKLEAERLRREQKRQDRERLRLQELSLKKQIEAYDSRIRTTVLELETQRSLQDSSHLQSKSRPVIGRPRQTDRRSSPATSPSASCSTTSRASERLQLSPGSVSESRSSRTGEIVRQPVVGKDGGGGDEEVIPAAMETLSHPTHSHDDGGDSPTAAVSRLQADGRRAVSGSESVKVDIETSDAEDKTSPDASGSSSASLEPPSDRAVQDGKIVSADSWTISVNGHDMYAASGSSQTYDEAESSVAEEKSMVVEQMEDEASGDYVSLQPLKLLVSDRLSDTLEVVVQAEEVSDEKVVTSSVEVSKAVEESTVRKSVYGLPSCLTTVADDHQTDEVKAASPESHHVIDSIGSSEIVSFCESQTSDADKKLNVGESCSLKDLEATNVPKDAGKEEVVESPGAEEVSEGNTSSNVLTGDNLFISESNDGVQNIVQPQHAEVIGAVGDSEVGKEGTLVIDEKGDVPAFLSEVGAVREVESSRSWSSDDPKLELSEEPKFHEAGDLPVLSAQDVSDVVRLAEEVGAQDESDVVRSAEEVGAQDESDVVGSAEEVGAQDESDVVGSAEEVGALDEPDVVGSAEEVGAQDESDVVKSAVSSRPGSPEESQTVAAVSEAYSEDFDASETSASPSESSSSSIAEDIKSFSAHSTASSDESLLAHLTFDVSARKVQQSQANVLGNDVLSASQMYPTDELPKEQASSPTLPPVTEANEDHMQSTDSGNDNVTKVIAENELSILMDKLFIKSGRSSKEELVNSISQSIIENLLRDSLAGGVKARSPVRGDASGLSCYEEAVSSLAVDQTDESDLFMSPRKIEQPSVFGTPVAVIDDVTDDGTDQTGERTRSGPVVLLDTKTPACEDVELVFSPSSSVPVFGSASLANAQGNGNTGGCLETRDDCHLRYQSEPALKSSEQQPGEDTSWNRSTDREVVDTQTEVTPLDATSNLVSSKAERIVKKIIDELFEDSWRELKRMYEVSKVPIVGSEPLSASSSARESAVGDNRTCSTGDVEDDGDPVWTAQPVFPSLEVHQLSSGLDRLEHVDHAEDAKLQMRERLIEDEIRQLEVLQKLSRGVIYMREIPDRPPPPYREPEQLLQSTSPSAAAVVSVPPAAAVGLSRADQQRLLQPPPRHLVPHGAVQVAPLLQEALELVHGGRDPGQFVEGAGSPDGRAGDPLAASARRQFRQFVLCYAEQSVSAELSAAAGDGTAARRRAWVRVRAARRTAVPFRRDRAAVDERVQQRLAVALGHRPAAARENLMVRWARKRRDLVDEVLVRELHEEEADWLDYSVEEAAVKRQLGLHMWDDLLSDSIGELLRIWHKRHVKQTDL